MCRFAGDGPDLEAMKTIAANLDFPEGMILFEGRLEGDALADLIREADFTVLSSRYETFGTVIIESLSCGVPVVSTAVGIAPSVITPVNGLLVSPGNHNDLYQAILLMIDHCREYDKGSIRNSVSEIYSIDSVASRMKGIYNKAIPENV